MDARRSRITGVIVFAALTRIMAVAVGSVAVQYFGVPRTAPTPSSLAATSALQSRWDAGYYVGIASGGYRRVEPSGRFENVAFFPAFPLSLRAVATVLPVPRASDVWAWVGAGVASGYFVAAMVYVYLLAEALGIRSPLAAVALLSLYPFAVFFSASYSEALFLLANVAACYHFGARREAVIAGGWGTLAGLCRPVGWLLSLPLLYELLRDRSRRSLAAFAAALSPVCGLLIYCAYLWRLTGDPLAWLHAQQQWGRRYEGVSTLFSGIWTRIATDGAVGFVVASPGDALNLLAVMFAAVMVIPVARRFGAGYAAFVAVSVALPLAFGGLMSLARFTAVLFPIFLLLADIRSTRTVVMLNVVFGCGQIVSSALFYTWRPLY